MRMLLILLFHITVSQSVPDDLTNVTVRELYETSTIGNLSNYEDDSRSEKLKEDEGFG